MVPTLLARICT